MAQIESAKKSKGGIIAISILSALLALSLIATVTLAYFYTANRATTTLTFAGGVKVTITGTSSAGVWGSNADNINNITKPVTLNALKVSKANDSSQDIKVAIHVTYTGSAVTDAGFTGATPTVATSGNGWYAITGKDGWFVYGSSATAPVILPEAGVDAIAEQTVGTAETMNDFAGKSLVPTFYVVAVGANDTLEDLNALIADASKWQNVAAY